MAHIQAARDDWRLLAVDVENELKKMPTGPARTEVVRQFCADMRNGEKPGGPPGCCEATSVGRVPRRPPAGGGRQAFPEQRKKAIEDRCARW